MSAPRGRTKPADITQVSTQAIKGVLTVAYGLKVFLGFLFA